MPNLVYFDLEHALEVQQFTIKESGGLSGLLNVNLIDSPLEHIKNDNYYPDLTHKLTHLVFSLSKNHGFKDANKRSSIVLGSYFLEINNYSYCIDKFIIEMENIAVAVADNSINKDLLLRIISSILYEDNYSEELKMEIYDALQKSDNIDYGC